MSELARMRAPATERWLIWLDAYRAQEAEQWDRAADLYDRIVPMFADAGLPKHADHFTEMARICRGTKGMP